MQIAQRAKFGLKIRWTFDLKRMVIVIATSISHHLLDRTLNVNKRDTNKW